jgi:NDP-sugar pyrophosphorylase family protein
MHVVLQAGGKGERLRSGETLPKPLFKVYGVPIIERLLRQLVEKGARVVTVITGFGGERVETAVRGLRGLPDDLELSFERETVPRGNAGSLALVRRDLPCLLCFADLVTGIDFGRLAAIHVERQAAVTLASHYEPLQVRLGELTTDGETVLAYREKPVHRVLIASGIAVFQPSVLDLIPNGQPSGLSEVVQSAIERGHRVTHWVHGSSWVDVNTAEDLVVACRLVAGSAQVA